jgi:hypothetical protein
MIRSGEAQGKIFNLSTAQKKCAQDFRRRAGACGPAFLTKYASTYFLLARGEAEWPAVTQRSPLVRFSTGPAGFCRVTRGSIFKLGWHRVFAVFASRFLPPVNPIGCKMVSVVSAAQLSRPYGLRAATPDDTWWWGE